MLTETMIAEGWLPWDGKGPCPVELDSRVSVMLRCGDVIHWARTGAGLWSRINNDRYSEIIAYKPEPKETVT